MRHEGPPFGVAPTHCGRTAKAAQIGAKPQTGYRGAGGPLMAKRLRASQRSARAKSASCWSRPAPSIRASTSQRLPMRRCGTGPVAMPQLFFKEQVTCCRHGKLVHRRLHPSGGRRRSIVRAPRSSLLPASARWRRSNAGRGIISQPARRPQQQQHRAATKQQRTPLSLSQVAKASS